MSAITKTSRNTGCGCSCGGTCSGACGCSGSAVCPSGAIARPRFFAGQLLTQEDLQLIVDYTVGKNRLHNRFLFGEGVVCGLTVTCPPCGDGTVVVSPGYALDCCGNDIHVPCREEVDVNALVRQLRLRQHDRWDCGDPCKGKTCDDDDDDDDRDDAPHPTYHYCLFVRYRETLVEPVAPYTSDAACGQVQCESTRICEGYEFELRCERKPGPEDIFDRLKACIGDLRAAAAASRKAQTNSTLALQMRKGAELAMASRFPLEKEDMEAVKAAGGRLDAAKFKDLDEYAVRNLLADYQVAGVGVARLRIQGRKLEQFPRDAIDALKKTTAPLRKAVGDVIDDPAAIAAATDLFELTERYALSDKAVEPKSDEARMYLAGAPTTIKQIARMRVDATQLKMFLQERLDGSNSLTRCDLIDRLHSIRIDGEDDSSIAGASRTARANEDLGLILLEYLRDCLCLALNPACAPCDDPAVLLACLDVRDCEVVDICNMSRRFVLSPAALRYWLPPLTALGKLVEWFCCRLEFKRKRVEPITTTDRVPTLAPKNSFFITSATPRLDTSRLDLQARIGAAALGIDLDDVEQAAIVAANLAVLGVHSVPIGETLDRIARGRLDARAARRRSTFDLDELRSEFARDVAEVGRTVKDEVAEALSDAALDKRLNAAKAIRDLRSELKKLSEAVNKPKG